MPKRAVKKLDRIIWQLEVWQNRYQVDDADCAVNSAKHKLMAVLQKLEIDLAQEKK